VYTGFWPGERAPEGESSKGFFKTAINRDGVRALSTKSPSGKNCRKILKAIIIYKIPMPAKSWR
jgi:hypothetical protein